MRRFASATRLRIPALPGLLFAMTLCNAGTPQAADPAGPPQQDLRWLAKASQSLCQDPSRGIECEAGNYFVELLPDCGAKGFFAGVADEEGATVYDRPRPNEIETRGILSQGQFVCIQGIGRDEQDPLWYYVIAVPVASVAACRDNPLCTHYGDRPIRRVATTRRDACHATPDGRYGGDCMHGWVDAKTLDVFSNGL